MLGVVANRCHHMIGQLWNVGSKRNCISHTAACLIRRLMKIVAIHDRVAPIASAIRNAFIDFSEMTVSMVAIVSDVKRNGRPLIGYGFNSNGRYAQRGILRERMIPRLLKAPPEALLSDDRANFDPFKAWQIMMCNEKPGGHGERSVAVGTLRDRSGAVDQAVWD